MVLSMVCLRMKKAIGDMISYKFNNILRGIYDSLKTIFLDGIFDSFLQGVWLF